MKQQYTSFKEIDERLKILRLQREIYKESLKLDLSNAKTNLNPVQMITAANLGWKRVLIDFAIKKGLQGLHKMRRKELSEQA